MKAEIVIGNRSYRADLNRGHDISIPLRHGAGVRAWYVDPIRIEPVRTAQFTGSVAEGGAVNFRDIYFNPHGHGTHTESYGHISVDVYSVNKALQSSFFSAILISVSPETARAETGVTRPGDLLITQRILEEQADGHHADALIIRTLPNHPNKQNINYSATNPAYFTPEAMQWIVARGFRHLLIDLPSVDRESDGGLLQTHRIFWDFDGERRSDATITEMVFVEDEIPDGFYLLNLQTAPFENDATPSRPVLYALAEV
jgi:arylformamidase